MNAFIAVADCVVQNLTIVTINSGTAIKSWNSFLHCHLYRLVVVVQGHPAQQA